MNSSGSASYSEGVFHLEGTGSGISGQRDSFLFTRRKKRGDFELSARVMKIGDDSTWVRTGVMIRDSLKPDSANAMVFLTSENFCGFQSRRGRGSDTRQECSAVSGTPYWLKIEKRGSTIRGFMSPDGLKWEFIGRNLIDMPGWNYAGLAVASNNQEVSCSVEFDNVSITELSGNPEPDNEPPSAVNGTTLSVLFDTTYRMEWPPARDNDGIMRYDIIRNKTKIGSTKHTFFTDITPKPAKRYNYTVFAFDNAGNRSPVGTVVYVNKPEVLHWPAQGSIYREYTWSGPPLVINWKGNKSTEAVSAMAGSMDMEEVHLHIKDMEKAVRAETVIEYWGGHPGTTDQKFSVNDGAFIGIPQPLTTSSEPECYNRYLPGATAEIPLEQLKQGDNIFRFTCGPQSCRGRSYSMYVVNSFMVRIYYDRSRKHPSGRILSPVNNTETGEMPEIGVKASSGENEIERIDIIGYFEDFDWNGDGIYREWQYQYEKGKIYRHIGTLTEEPYRLTWDTTWVPDQDIPVRIAACITDKTGMISVADVVRTTFTRTESSVRLYMPFNVPCNFTAEPGKNASCMIDVIDSVEHAVEAKLLLPVSNGSGINEISLNRNPFAESTGKDTGHGYSIVNVPVGLIRMGLNNLTVSADGSPVRINWPGPVLKIKFSQKVVRKDWK